MSFNIRNGESFVKGDFSKLENLVKNLEKKMYVDIGIIGASNKTDEEGLTIAGVGAVQEFGTDRAGRGNKTVIPERSFIKMPLETGQESIEKSIEPKIKGFIEKGDIAGLFKLIGVAGEARIQEAFDTAGFGEWPENSEVTIEGSKPNKKGEQFIKGKGSNSPLINEGILRGSITSKVGGK